MIYEPARNPQMAIDTYQLLRYACAQSCWRKDMMFRRLRRAYHEWRIRLIEDDMRRTQDELNKAVAASDYDAINNSCYWLEILEADQRRHAYALSKIPQPT